VASVFIFIGLASCIIAAIRGRGGVRPLIWQGIFAAIYGARMLAQSPGGFSVLPQSLWASRESVVAVATCLIPIPGILFWWELSLGKLRRFTFCAV